MDERELAIICAKILTAMRTGEPNVLDPVIADLRATPWYPEVAEVIDAVRSSLEKQKYAKKKK